MNKQSIKGSEVKKVREKILETYPLIEPYMDQVWGKDAKVLKSKVKV